MFLQWLAGGSDGLASCTVDHTASLVGEGAPKLEVASNAVRHSQMFSAVSRLAGCGGGVQLVPVGDAAAGVVSAAAVTAATGAALGVIYANQILWQSGESRATGRVS